MASLKLASFLVLTAISAVAVLLWTCNVEYFSQPRVPSSESYWKEATQRVKGNKDPAMTKENENFFSMIRSFDGLPTHSKKPQFFNGKWYNKSLPNVSVNEDQDHIWFLETSYQGKLLAREGCSIESACRNNGDFTVHLLSTGNISSSGCPYHCLLSKLPNFRSTVLNASLELTGAPLELLHAMGGALNRSAYNVEHLSDFLRYVVLWKHGGIYLDTDVIVMKSLKGINNSVFYQSANKKDSLASSVLFFDKQHPVLREIINECALAYSPRWLTVCGPSLMSRLPSDAKISGRVKFLGSSYFFRVPFTMWKDLFNATMAPGVLRTINGSYGVHFWNKQSKGKRVVPGSGSAIEVLARAYCPETYRLAISEGYF